MSSPQPLKDTWVIGDDYLPTDQNTVADTVNWLLTHGGGGSSTQVFGEAPSGTQDGTNDTFTVAHGFVSGSTCVYRNGLRERVGDGYTESSPQIVFSTAPLPTDVIEVDYLIA